MNTNRQKQPKMTNKLKSCVIRQKFYKFAHFISTTISPLSTCVRCVSEKEKKENEKVSNIRVHFFFRKGSDVPESRGSVNINTKRLFTCRRWLHTCYFHHIDFSLQLSFAIVDRIITQLAFRKNEKASFPRFNTTAFFC